MREIRNARIESTMLGYEDHGVLTCMLHLNYGGSGQGFGGYAFDEPVHDPDGNFTGRIGSAYGMEFIIRLLKTAGVDRWEQLPGCHVRVDASSHKVHRIGHLLNDRWFDPDKLRADVFCQERLGWDGDTSDGVQP